MVSSKITTERSESKTESTSKRRRLRRQRLKVIRKSAESSDNNNIASNNNNTTSKPAVPKISPDKVLKTKNQDLGVEKQLDVNISNNISETKNMSTKESTKSRDDVLAARESKKLAKLKGKSKEGAEKPVKDDVQKDSLKEKDGTPKKDVRLPKAESKAVSPKCVDEVDKAAVKETIIEKEISTAAAEKTKEQIIAERAAKKAAKQAKKKGTEGDIAPNPDMTVKDVVETLKDIKNVAKDIQDITAKVSAIHFEDNKQPKETKVDNPKGQEEGKTKAELKAERRAKQEAQRAAKQVATEQKVTKHKVETVKVKPETTAKLASEVVKEKSPKPKTDKSKLKSISANRVNWFQHLYAEHDKEALKKIALNSNLHPAIIKLGVQLASRVVTGANARCIALLDALKKMVRDYTLPAKTEFSRGLEAHLAASLEFLWAMRQPAASQTNAVKYFRHQLTQLPNNVDEFDAKKILQEEIDKYIEDQIDKAGEAISMTVQKKISTGDNILTYGCSSLIERILREAWQGGLKFRTVVVGDRVRAGARDMLRRLAAAGLPCIYGDITAISFLMMTIDKVVVGAESVLANGAVVGAAGTALVALAARARNKPLLVACETHKFSDRVQTDAFVYNELGDPDALIDKTDENSPLKDWRSNPNLTPLNLTYDVTPASLVTAVVTEKAILPCTSAPVVLRTKLTEYGM